jgi:transmembrane sensor
MKNSEPSMPDFAQWWPAIEAKVSRKNVRRARLRAATRAGAAALCLLLVGWVALAYFNRNTLRVFGSPSQSVWLGAEVTQEISFSDKSNIALEPLGELRLVDIGPKNVELELKKGRARFSVTPGGPRQWRIRTQLAQIRVIGTSFAVDTSDGRVSVQVSHGLVMVSGPCVENGELSLREGEQIIVSDCDDKPAPAAVETEPEQETTTVEKTTELKRRVKSKAVAVEHETRSPDEVLIEIETLRRAGQYNRAVKMCRQLIAQHPSSPQAPLAAFLAGRISQESLSRWAEAGAFFEQALQLHLDPSLAKDAVRRSRENYERAGMLKAAKRVDASHP